MEAVGQLASGVAHDFNNVLQIISSNLQLMERDPAQPRARLQTALSAVERGSKLSYQLLAFARRQPLLPVLTHLGTLLHNIEPLLQRALGDQVALDIDVAPRLWNTAVDPNQMENALLNLAINARDAMDGSGTLTIRAANVGRGAARPHEVPDGEYVLIEVADTGKGMPPEILQRAFEPFFTTKPTGQGTGLGLSMAYGFVKQSGGEIVLASEPGKGTSVRIWLPRSEAEPAAIEDVAEVPLQRGLETILVVEDEEDVRSATCGILSALGYRVLEAPDAAMAKRMIEDGQYVDLVFTDVMMPGPVSSLQLGEAVRARLPRAQVLYTSGYAEGVLAHEGRLEASVNLLQKPYHPDALSARIRHLLRRS
jgi:CheY-like chemotaxis protein